MSNDNVNVHGRGSRSLPSAPTTDGLDTDLRVSRYGEPFNQPIGRWRQALADEGTYFVAHNNTIDAATTLAGHAAPVLADGDATMTKPLIYLRHEGASSSQIRCYLDFIEIEVMVAGANGTSDHWSAQLDSGATRYSSGTVETFTAYNPNMQSSATPVLVAKGGPFVASAETTAVRRIGHGTFKSAIEVAGDVYLFQFGADPVGRNKVASAATIFPVNMPPVVLGPTDALLLCLFQVAQDTAGVYKVRMGWWER